MDTSNEDPEYIPTHHTTPEELKMAIGEDKLAKIVAYAPKLEFMKDDLVLLHAIGRQRIEAKICTLKQENKHDDVKRLEDLLSY
jgi:hypothetical protein